MAVNCDDLQNLLLEELFHNSNDQKGVLLCDPGFESYKKDLARGKDILKLVGIDPLLEGCALLGCDGIHYGVRHIMNNSIDAALL